jgi:hypothetical protein
MNGYHATCFRVFAFRLARAKLVQIEQSVFSVKPPVAVNTILARKRGDALLKATHRIIHNSSSSRTSPPSTHPSPYTMDTCQKCPLRRHTPHLLSRIYADIEIGGVLRAGTRRRLAATIVEDPDLIRVLVVCNVGILWGLR